MISDGIPLGGVQRPLPHFSLRRKVASGQPVDRESGGVLPVVTHMVAPRPSLPLPWNLFDVQTDEVRAAPAENRLVRGKRFFHAPQMESRSASNPLGLTSPIVRRIPSVRPAIRASPL